MADINGTAGNDVLRTSGWGDSLHGRNGHDTLYADGGLSYVYGDNGNDKLYAGSGFNSLYGGYGDDRLFTGTGNADFYGGAGNDTFVIGKGRGFTLTIEDFKSGYDKIDVSALGITSLDQLLLRFGTDFSTGTGSVYTRTTNALKATDFIFDTKGGGPRNLEGTSASAAVFGGTSNDTLRGHGHRLLGGNGDDTLIADGGNNLLAGGQGKDKFILGATKEPFEDVTEDTIVDFQQGVDKIDVSALGISNFSQILALTDNFVGGDGSGVSIEIWTGGTLRKIAIKDIYRENLKSTDFIYSTGGARELYGKSGTDTLLGSSHADKLHANGSDKLFGGNGNDTLYSSSGDVYLHGQSGDDFFVISDRTGYSRTTIHDFMPGTEKIDISAWGITSFGQLMAALDMYGQSAYINANYNNMEYSLTLRNVRKDLLAASDFIFSTGGDFPKVGTDNDDKLFASDRGDTLDGKDGDDGLYGGRGADILIGGDGRNTFYGGAGKDTFVIVDRESGLYETKNIILDFTKGSDKIDVSALGISNFDQLKYIMEADGADVFINAYYEFIEHSITIKKFDLKKLTASDFIFHTGRTLQATGSEGRDVLFGGNGNDTLKGGEDDDILFGGAGNDILIGGSGGNMLYGQSGADIFLGVSRNLLDTFGSANTIADFKQGEDKIDISAFGISSFDQLQYILEEYGTANTRFDAFYRYESYSFTINNVSIDKIKSSDFIYFNGGAQNLKGTEGNDRIFGSRAGDVLTGGSGNDELYGGDGYDTLNGGDNSDGLVGGAGNDTLIGGAMADALLGGTGSDTASYYDATKGVVASLTDSLINTGDAKGDLYSSIENLTGSRYADTLVGDAQNNILTGGSGGDLLQGGGGRDTASYAGASKGVVANLADSTANTNDAAGDRYDSIECLVGTAHEDALTGNQYANTISGGEGNDKLDGGSGNDILIGGAGADRLIGGAGVDTASYQDAAGGIIANLGDASLNTGDAKGDTYSAIENLVGSGYADTLKGNSGDNNLNGGDGDDKLYGGNGNDVLIGGAGKDMFVFHTALSPTNIDTIEDFSAADDTIRLDDDIFTMIGKVGSLSSDAFYSGTKAHDASDRIIYDKVTGKLWYDADGTGKGVAIEFAQLDKGLIITADDFGIMA